MLAVQRVVEMEESSHAGIFESILIPKECSSWNPPIGVKAKTSITTTIERRWLRKHENALMTWSESS